ncbi:legumain-like [Limulus polyphemus]|uniref:Legumain-like n=1 Tax=Limulus polyphemus TaxID=6850 RepID=A0ABM1BJI2_LIMPO|nr:legumain-like [Limulus polyphemus]
MKVVIFITVVAYACALSNGRFNWHEPKPLFNLVNSQPDSSKLWAVLVAGSDSWYNYRHQADICHAYQILHAHGVPDEQIIVFMKDDLANNPEFVPEMSSCQGFPPSYSPLDVGSQHIWCWLHLKCEQVETDFGMDAHLFQGEKDVTPQNFLNVLQGNEEAMKGIGSGKVLKSGPNDHVFVNFADHGAPGIIAFPSDVLKATDLNKAIKNMQNRKMYEKMVFYIEACESGSMFKNLLPDNISVFATTASNDRESSYACYYDEERRTYLGDVYSVKWMEDSDQEQLTKETLQQQFLMVKKETNTSHVQEYGDLTIGKMHVSEFQGKKSVPLNYSPKIPLDAVPSEDVPLAILQRRLAKAGVEEKPKLQEEFNRLTQNRNFLKSRMMELILLLGHEEDVMNIWNEHSELTEFDCYYKLLEYFHDECFDITLNQYTLRYLYLLVNMCEAKIPVENVQQAMDQVCTHPPVYGII